MIFSILSFVCLYIICFIFLYRRVFNLENQKEHIRRPKQVTTIVHQDYTDNVIFFNKNHKFHCGNMFERFKRNVESHHWVVSSEKISEDICTFCKKCLFFSRKEHYVILECYDCSVKAVAWKSYNRSQQYIKAYVISNIFDLFIENQISQICKLPLETEVSDKVDLSCNYFKLKSNKITPMKNAINLMKEGLHKKDAQIKNKEELRCKIQEILNRLNNTSKISICSKYGFDTQIRTAQKQLNEKMFAIYSEIKTLRSERDNLNLNIFRFEEEIKEASVLFDAFYASNAVLDKDTTENWALAQSQWKDEIFRIVSEIETNVTIEDPLEEEFRLLEAKINT